MVFPTDTLHNKHSTFNNNIQQQQQQQQQQQSQRGPTRFDPCGVTLRRAGHHGQARNMFSSFQFRVLPIPASRPMPSGHFMYMALPPTKDTAWERLMAQPIPTRPVREGDLGSPNGRQKEPIRSPWAALAAQAAKRRSKRLAGSERRGALNVTQTVGWGTCVPRSI